MHGIVDDSQTWVLDQDELASITATQAHALFLSTLYLNNTVLFVGVSADDIALSGPLLTLNRSGFEPAKLFWLTTRQDLETQKWASENNIQLIPYVATEGADHEATIREVVEDISSFRSVDERKPEPLAGAVRMFFGASESEAPDEVANFVPEQARKALSNAIAKRLRGAPAGQVYEQFMTFVKEYDYPIQTRAFYRSPAANLFFDYKLKFPPMGTGNFGTVYQAEGPSGEIVAVKVMHNNILLDQEMLGGFRRGSKSMSILTHNNVKNVARLIESFEMPPTIVMEYISGNSLSEIFDSVVSATWSAKVNILRDISIVVDSCHKLPDSVLHRDLKPSNVMVEGFDYTDNSYSRVVVLDFDMSWHKGSSEKDVVFESRDDFGYLSPEQTDPSGGTQSRSARVDSYGLGMTAFAIFGGKHPIPNAPLDPRWPDLVAKATKAHYHGDWTCLPNLLSRAVVGATEVEQAARLEFSSLRGRLEKVAAAASGFNAIVSMDLAAEEILCRVSGTRPYEWDDISDSGSSHSVSGATMRTWVDHDKTRISVSVEYVASGAQNYHNRDTLLADCRSYLARELGMLGYSVSDISQRAGYLFVQFSIAGAHTLKTVAAAVDLVEGGLRFINRI
jgi:serine/threonine protein kinase